VTFGRCLRILLDMKFRICYRRVEFVDSYLDVEADSKDAALAQAETLLEDSDELLVKNEAPESYSRCYEPTGDVDVLEEDVLEED
jgi:hypothetical protein